MPHFNHRCKQSVTVLSFFFFLYSSLMGWAGVVHSIANGNWSSGATWSSGSVPNTGADAITVSNNVIVDANIHLSGAAKLTVTGKLIDAVGGTTYALSVSNNSWLMIGGNVTFEGKFTLDNNGTLTTITSGDTLSVGSAFFSNNADLTINTGDVLIVNGNLDASNNVNSTLDGKIIVNGNFTGSNNVTFSGNGSMTTTGAMTFSNNASAFGSSSGCAPGPCEASKSGVGPLPISLLFFNAKPNGKAVDISWATASETNNHYFTIEHSEKGVNFSQVATMDGAGNSTTQKNYSSVDNEPYNNVSYYRLKQTDFNGKFTYSNVVIANMQDNIVISIFPNPTSGIFYIASSIFTVSTLEIYNVLGEKLYSAKINSEKTEIDVSNQPKGIYFCKVLLDDGRIEVQKVVVQ